MENGEKFFKKSAVNYKYIPVSVFDVAKCGKTTIRGKQDHNKQSNRVIDANSRAIVSIKYLLFAAPNGR